MDWVLLETLNFEGYRDILNSRIKRSNKIIILAKYDVSVTYADFIHKLIHKQVNTVYCSFETHFQIKTIQEKNG